MTLFLYMATVSTVTATLIHYTETMKRIRDMHEYRSHMVMKMLDFGGLYCRTALYVFPGYPVAVIFKSVKKI